MDDSIFKLGFDRYQRFRLTQELIDSLALGGPLSILEVGAFDNAFQPFVAGHRHSLWPREVRPGEPIDFADNTFDVTLALDVLEHVPAEERGFFVSECARVASNAFIIGFPVSTSLAAEQFVLKLTGSAWLAQHQELGLPDKSEMEALFKKLGLSFTCHANGSLPSWTAMMLLMHGLRGEQREEVSDFFNRRFYALENREPAYRYIYVLQK